MDFKIKGSHNAPNTMATEGETVVFTMFNWDLKNEHLVLYLVH